MRILITGVAGFVGTALAQQFKLSLSGIEILGIDNFSRPGSEINRSTLKKMGVELRHGDIRCSSDLALLPGVDWVIDAAALPSVTAGIDTPGASRQLMEVNLIGTINLLEYCRRHSAGFVLISTNRVYNITSLADLPLNSGQTRFELNTSSWLPDGTSLKGLSESFSTASPNSLYGTSKLCAENLAREYGLAFDMPVWINRCGILAGAGQFGRPDQGILAYWLHSWLYKKPLKYIGFGGGGHQVRDCLHPQDLAQLLCKQLHKSPALENIFNIGGGQENTFSLMELSGWCTDRWGPHSVESVPDTRQFDVPWLAMDSRLASSQFDWSPQTSLTDILSDIGQHAEDNPDWLDKTI